MDEVVDETDPARFDLLVFPGGVANPDQLRAKPAAVAFARSFVEAGKPAAVICHGPWTLVEADVVRGRHPTSWPSVTTDLRKAGATWRDDEVVVCDCGPGPIISSRKPPDRPAFCRTMMKSRRASAADIARAPHRARAPESGDSPPGEVPHTCEEAQAREVGPDDGAVLWRRMDR